MAGTGAATTMNSQDRSTLEYKVFCAARDNMSLTLYALLYKKSRQEIRQLLSHLTVEDEQSQTVTPLIIAAKNGHSKVVQVLLMDMYDVDVEQVGTVKFDGFVIEGATALWCSSGAGHQDVVKLLLTHGADVNHATYTNSTPLRAACFDGHVDVVKLLVSQGADIHIPNKYKNTCLMIACYKGHDQVVEFLLESGANTNDRAHCDATALHFAAERGLLQSVRYLIDFGAGFYVNDQNMSPLHVAADNSQADVVEFFISLTSCSKLDRIEALELLGASYANDKDNYDIQKCYHYLWLAMHERFSSLNNAEHKQIAAPNKAYNYHVECSTIEELESIQDTEDALHMEALIVRERILGQNNAEIPHPIVFRGAVFADAGRFDRCTALWLRALVLQQSNDRSVAKDLMRFAQVFSQMIQLTVNVSFSVVHTIFQHNVSELARDLERCRETCQSSDEHELVYELLELNIHCAIYLLAIMDKLQRSKQEEFTLCQDVYRFNKLQIALRANGHTPLHMVCEEKTFVDDFHVNEIVSFPHSTVVALLVKCGADVNAVDLNGNTPLHTIVRYNRPISDFLTLHNIIIKLVEAGTHVDRPNTSGETAMEHTTTGVAEIILRSRRKISLKCIAARAVKLHGISYVGQVPSTLEHFLSIH